MPSRIGQQLSGRSFLYRTPQALHSVRGPSGPHRHWGVWWQPQFRHTVRRALRPAREHQQGARLHGQRHRKAGRVLQDARLQFVRLFEVVGGMEA